MKFIDDALLYQIEAEIDFHNKISLYKAHENISGGNALWTEQHGFKILKDTPATKGSWILNALSGQDVYIGGNTRKIIYERSEKNRTSSLDTSLLPSERNPGSQQQSLRIDSYIESVFGVFYSSDGNIRRLYPSAGGLYTTQLIVIKKIYTQSIDYHGDWVVEHYMPIAHMFEKIAYINMEELKGIVGSSYNINIDKLDFILAYVVFPSLSIAKYGNRGYKFSLMEVGHMVQCAIDNADKHELLQRVYGYFDEHAMPSFLGLNPHSAWVECLHCFKFKD